MVNSCENTKANGIENDVVEMSDNEISITYVDINGCGAKHDPSNPSKDEIYKSAKHK